MFISKEEADKRLSSAENIVNTSVFNIIEMTRSGRRPGDKEKPDELRALIGVTSALFGPTIAARTFDCSPYEAHALEHGKIQGKDGNLPQKIEDKLTPIRDKALERTLKALELIDDEKLDNTKNAKDLSNVAMTLSKVAQNVTPQLNQNAANAIQFNFYAPRMKDEDSFEVIEVSN